MAATQPPANPAPWQREDATAAATEQQRRRWQRRVLIALVIVTGTGLGVLFWLSPVREASVVPLWITRQPNARTHLPWTEQDRQSFIEGRWLGNPGDSIPVQPNRDQIRLKLRTLVHMRSYRPVVVYLSGPACRAPGGEVYLLSGDAIGDHPRNRLPLREVLEALRECPSRHQLLVLDLCWERANPGHSELCADVAAGIQWELDSTPDARRLCLTSCAPGQAAFASTDLGRTVFGHYLEEGLRGFADGWPPGDRDGRITVNELATFVRARVERWSRLNRDRLQSPTLHGSAADFALRVVSIRSVLPAQRSLPESEAYPEWLQTAWLKREQWLTDGRATAAPRQFRQLEQRLLDADHDWHAGRPGNELQTRLAEEVARLEAAAAPYARRELPDPPPTLALARQATALADRELTEQLRRAVHQAETRPKPPVADKAAPAVLAPELEPFRAKPHATVACAAFDVLAEEARPPAQRARLLHQLLSAQQPVPQFAETLLVRRLAELADLSTDADWPAEAVGTLVDAWRTIEEVASEPGMFADLEAVVTRADQLRHDAESLLFAQGYASSDAVGERMRLLRDAIGKLRRDVQLLRLARSTRDEALAILPGCFTALDDLPEFEERVLAAADAAAPLAALLRARSESLAEQQLESMFGDIEAKQAVARRALDEVKRFVHADALARIRRNAETIDATPSTLRYLNGLLQLPILPASERLPTEQIAAALSRRFNDEVMFWDRIEAGVRPEKIEFDTPFAPQPGNDVITALRRARRSLALLRLTGAEPGLLIAADSAIRDLEAAKADTDGILVRLAQAMHAAWDGISNASVVDEQLLAVYPAFDRLAADNLPRAPLLQSRQQTARRMWKWQALRWHYEARDSTDPVNLGAGRAFAAGAARSFRAVAGSVSEGEYIVLSPSSKTPELTPAAPIAEHVQRFQVIGPDAARRVSISFHSPDPRWLVEPGGQVVNGGPTGEGVFRIPLEAGSGGVSSVAKRGLLVEARVGDRSFQQRLPVDLDALTNRIEILFSRGPSEEPDGLRPLYLRPVTERQPIFLFLRNPTTKERTVILRLPGLRRETAKLTLAPKKFEPVILLPLPSAAAPAPMPMGTSPGPELQDMTAPLAIELLNGETREVIQTAKLRVEVADPVRYIDVEEIVFAPRTDDKPNRLTARLSSAGKLALPPCPVEMALPRDRNPELGVRDGKLSGILPPDAKPLDLYVENLSLPQGADQRVVVTFTADGSERAFTFVGTFANSGPPIRLSPIVEPSLRLKAEAFARGDRPLPVRVEVDNAPEGSQLELRLGQAREGGFAMDGRRLLPTPRQRSLAFAVNPADSSLLFQATLRDWETTFPIEQIVGQRELQARLLDSTGTQIAFASMIVTFDINLPDGVRIVDPPPRARRDQPLVLKATGDAAVSGIKDVLFFFGKPVKGALPPNAPTFPAEASDRKGSVWKAALPVGERKGPIEISVQLTNRAGLSAFDTVTVDLLDPADFLKPLPGNIEGRLREGNLAQGGLKVYLFDEKGVAIREATTKSDGSFQFVDLPPGNYTLYSVKTATNRSATKPIAVDAGKTAKVELELFL